MRRWRLILSLVTLGPMFGSASRLVQVALRTHTHPHCCRVPNCKATCAMLAKRQTNPRKNFLISNALRKSMRCLFRQWCTSTSDTPILAARTYIPPRRRSIDEKRRRCSGCLLRRSDSIRSSSLGQSRVSLYFRVSSWTGSAMLGLVQG